MGPQFGDRDLVFERPGSGVRPMLVDFGFDASLAVWPRAGDFPSLSLTSSSVMESVNEPLLSGCCEDYQS